MEKQGNSPRIRISWKIGKGSGHGDWHPAGDRSWLQVATAACNRDYGPSTHWVEEEVLRKKPRLRRTRIGDYICRCETVTGRAWTPEDAYEDWKRVLRWYASEGYWKEHFPNERQ